MDEFPQEMVELINLRLGGFNNALGLKFVQARREEFVSELAISDDHLQPYGLVHGGVYCSMVETTCSTAAALDVFGEGKSAVGLENATAFLKSVRSGTLRCTATPLVRGRRSHVWEARVRDDRDRIVASGRVRMMILEPGTRADGEVVGMKAD